MVSHEHSIVIHAPLSEVFAYVNAPATLPDWMTGMIEVRNIVGSGAGLQYDWTYTMVGVRLRDLEGYLLNIKDTLEGNQ
jgi:hypothetical protein